MDLSTRVRHLRIDRGLSQREVAAALDVTRQTVTAWESGKAKPRVDTLERLARLLGTTSSYLMHGSDPQIGADELENALLISFRLLNRDGQRRVCDYAEDLVDSGRYRLGDGYGPSLSPEGVSA